MSIHSDLMRAATDVHVAVQGDTGELTPIVYQPAKGQAFRWEGSSLGEQRGHFQPQDNGDVLKVTLMHVQGPTAELVAHGVLQLERDAIVTAGGFEWSIDLAESRWGPSMVRLGLTRRPISRHAQQEMPPGAGR